MMVLARSWTAIGLCTVLAGCHATSLQLVKVPVPIECSVEVPARPAMPTEALRPGVDVDQFAASVLAELEIREGYEGELLIALMQCKRSAGDT